MFSSVIIACENNSLSVVCLLTFAVRPLVKNDSRKYCSGAERVKLASPVSFPPKLTTILLGTRVEFLFVAADMRIA